MGLLIPYSPYKIQCKNCSKANLCLGTDHPESSLYLCSSCLTHFRAFVVSLCPSALRERDKPGSHCWGLPVPSSLLAGTSPQLLVPQHSFPLTPLRRPGRQDQKAQRPESRAQSERRSVVRQPGAETGAHRSAQPASGSVHRHAVRESRTLGVPQWLLQGCQGAGTAASPNPGFLGSGGTTATRPRSAHEAPKPRPRPPPRPLPGPEVPASSGHPATGEHNSVERARAPVSPPWATARAAATSSGSTATSHTRSGARRCSVSACDHSRGPGGRSGMGGQ